MGATKRMSELVLQSLAQEAREASNAGGARTTFCMVRFGNVLGSSGGVTHADVTRHFMTTHETAQLVLQAGAMVTGGDVCVIDMGVPVKILDFAQRMVELSGLRWDALSLQLNSLKKAAAAAADDDVAAMKAVLTVCVHAYGPTVV